MFNILVTKRSVMKLYVEKQYTVKQLRYTIPGLSKVQRKTKIYPAYTSETASCLVLVNNLSVDVVYKNEIVVYSSSYEAFN